MDSLKQPSATRSSKSKLARTFAKVLHIRVASGIAPVDGKIKKVKPELKKVKEDRIKDEFEEKEVDELIRKRDALEAFLAKLFASISSVKANYAYLQFSQSPYDAYGIQSADDSIVSELKSLYELKQCFVKRQLNVISPETTLLAAEIEEQKSLLKTYEVTIKKMEFQIKLKDSEITFLKEKLEESRRENYMAREKNPGHSGPLSGLESIHGSGLGTVQFVSVLRHAMKSIRSFVRLLIDEMKSADWDIEAAASSIEPGVSYSKADHKCFAFESFVCREMFDSFERPNFGLPNGPLPEKPRQKRLFFNRFLELKSVRARDYLENKPSSDFAMFCRAKYMSLVHPKMEWAFFGNLSQRELVGSGRKFPETTFFAMFAEVARRVWLLHCLAFSFEVEVDIFQVWEGCRFSEVYMESVAEPEVVEDGSDYEPRVAFTVVPGFRIGGTVVQCQVYLVSARSR